MEAAIHVPPFPPLTWRRGIWYGEVLLTSWAGFLGSGPSWLWVFAEDKAPPTPEQAAAFRHLLDNEASVTAAITRALLEYYPGARARCIDAYDGDSACIAEVEEILPEVVTDPAGLHPLVGLSGVNILPVARDGAAYVGFHLGCEWDEEHGAGVLTHRDRVVLTGQADVAGATWAARKDAARAEPNAAPDRRGTSAFRGS
jgi:hypothetical protein